jgi:hypothetical protein
LVGQHIRVRKPGSDDWLQAAVKVRGWASCMPPAPQPACWVCCQQHPVGGFTN